MASIERVQRLLKLVGLLQSGRNFNSAHLADICQVSRRTVFRDIKTLQESGVSVNFDENKQGYSLPPTSFLPPTELTLEETISLLLLCHELGGQTGGVPFQHPARSAALKLLSNLPRHLRDYVGEVTASMEVGPNPHNPLDDAKPFYQQLLDALANGRQIRIGYDSLFEQQKISTLLSPYRIFFHRRSWYVVGRSSLHRAVRTFNDRANSQGRNARLNLRNSPTFQPRPTLRQRLVDDSRSGRKARRCHPVSTARREKCC